MPTLFRSIPFIKIVLLFFFGLNASAQNKIADQLISHYEDYSAAPRELVFVHLNKSTYIEGEMLGFTAYTFDKFTKERSLMTTNLYCTITDEQQNIITQKLIEVRDGVAFNTFNIGGEFTTGTYIFKAYTNWMKNFDEQNHFQQSFLVLDADNQTEIKPNKQQVADVQLLGEGGHILYDVVNTVGIIAKDNKGYGIPMLQGTIVDENQTIIAEVTLNELGIGKSLFKPLFGKSYFLNYTINDKTYTKEITDFKNVGFNISVNDLQDKIAIKFATNDTSFGLIADNDYYIVVHNGSELRVIPFRFNDKHVLKVIPKTELFSGINIITVFDEKKKPILERLYFNTNNLKQESISSIAFKKATDSINVEFSFKNFVKDKYNSVSVSVLPTGTKSYTHHNNILSQVYLQPYVKGAIENASYYFRNMDRKKAYELDALLITQGWSSYDWSNIFSFNDVFIYPFERGIDVVATINSKKDDGLYLVYPTKNSNTQIFSLSENENVFTQKRVIPFEGETLRIGKIGNKGSSPGVFPQFFPSSFAIYYQNYNYLEATIGQDQLLANTVPELSLSSWNRAQELDEVVIEGKRQYTRLEKLKRKSNGAQIYEIDNLLKNRAMPLWQYINSRTGFRANYDLSNNELTISNPRVTWGPNTPMVYLDDALLTQGGSLNILSTINLEVIDYIEAQTSGVGGGLRGGQAGYIKIYTSPDYYYRNSKTEKLAEFEFPLTFNAPQKYYTPVYQFYKTKFFKEYGVISWFPELKPNNNGKVSFKIPNTFSEGVSLFIEGVCNNNSLLSQIIELE